MLQPGYVTADVGRLSAMTPPKLLTSPQNRHIKAVTKLRRHRERRRSELFIVEGVRDLTRALAAGLHMKQLFICPDLTHADTQGFIRTLPGLHEAVRAGSLVFEVTPALMHMVAYRQNPEGILALIEQPRPRLEDLPITDNAIFLVAVGTTKPGNLGAMARSAAAAGASAVLVADAVVDPFNPNAIRASTGAVFTLPVIEDAAAVIQRFLIGRGIRVIAADVNAPSVYSEVDLAGPVAFIIGSEHIGLSESWLGFPGGTSVAIPVLGRTVDSLNASTAAAVLLYEAVRQRRDKCRSMPN